MKRRNERKVCRAFPALLATFLVAGGAVFLSSCAGHAVPDVGTGYVQSAAQQSEAAGRITVSGTVESARSRSVYTTLGYFIEYVGVEIGDTVTERQIIATLDTEDLELTIAQARAQLELAQISAQVAIEDSQRMLEQASANLANNSNVQVLGAEAALRSAESNLNAIQNNLSDAQEDYSQGSSPHIQAAEAAVRNASLEQANRQTDYENAKLMYEVGGISQIELRGAQDALTFAKNNLGDAQKNLDSALTAQQRTIEQLETSLASAETALRQARSAVSAARNAARQDVDRLESGLEAARISANLEAQEIAIQILERRLEDSQIRAPISGTITQSFAREGMIGSGLLFVIEDTNDLRIITRFREYDIGIVTEGMEVYITSEATGSEIYTGKITRINPAAIGGAALSPVVEFEAEIAVTSETTSLRIGMNVRVNLAVD